MDANIRKYLSGLFGLLMFSVNSSYAQVTIGSEFETRKGSLLDIKQENTTGHESNTFGGLVLPRVALVSPTTLTIDDDSQKINYIGVMVYNVTNNANIKEGTYFWDGTKWKLSIAVDTYGKKDQSLRSKGDGTFDWTDIIIPDYSYHKPTQISAYSNNKEKKTYNYGALTSGGSGSWAGAEKPADNTFNDAFFYDETLTINTAAGKEKYLLLGISCNIEVATLNGYTPKVGFWQIIQLDVYIGDEIVQTHQRLYPTPAQGDKTVYVDMFSVVPLNKFGESTPSLRIKISNVENTFKGNIGNEDGNFNSSTTNFYTIILTDINFILYESD